MDNESRLPGKGSGSGNHRADDEPTLSRNQPQTQLHQRHRVPFRVVIARGLWRGFDVAVTPPTITHPLRSFHDHATAMAFAEALARLEGWPIIDRTGGAS